MKKMWLITRREYLTRVRNKTFLLSTFLLPVVFIVFIAGAVVLACAVLVLLVLHHGVR